MKVEQWPLVKHLVLQALRLSQQERPAFVASRSCDPVVAIQLESIISRHEQNEFEEFPKEERFLAIRRIRSGRFGTVFEAFDTQEQIVLALKVLRQSDPNALERFKKEFYTLRDMEPHPSLIKLYQLFNESDRWFFSMQLIRGTGFLDYVWGGDSFSSVDKTSCCDPVRLRQALLGLARGIAALHANGKLHRDIKPDNVMVASDGAVIVLDLGLSRELAAEHVQQSVAILGTPRYLSPEQGSYGMLSEATDWYSLGIILFEALTGHVPFDGSLHEIIEKKRRGFEAWPAENFPGGFPDLQALCRDLLQPESIKRPKGEEVLMRLGEIPERTRSASVEPRTPFVGREETLLRILEFFEAVQGTRQPVMILLKGKSGIGKSALLRELERRIRKNSPNALVLSGRCHESARMPYNALDAVFDNLTEYLKALPALEAKALLPRDAECLARLFPVLKQIEAISHQQHSAKGYRDSQDLRNRGFDAAVDLLGRLADRTPVLFEIDDVQWGDQDSATWFENLLCHRSPPSLLVVLSYRSEDADSPFVRSLAEMQQAASNFRMAHLDLDVLSAAESEQLVRNLLIDEMQRTPEVISRIMAESEGIPFFITEFASYANLCAKERATPVFTIDEAIDQRMTQLPLAARKLLQVVAVAGQPIPSSVAHKAAELEADDFPGLQSLTAARLVRHRNGMHGNELEIYHERYREAVLRSMQDVARGELHSILAQRMSEHSWIDHPFIANQFRLAGENEQAAFYYRQSAELAANSFAFDQAALFYRQALRLNGGSASESVALRRTLADTLANAGRPGQAAEEYLLAAGQASAAVALELKRQSAEQFLMGGYIDRGMDVMGAVLGAVGLRLPSTPNRALISLLIRRGHLFLRGLRFSARPESAMPADQLLALDTCWSISTGLAIVDSIQAAELQSRHLLMALRSGDEYRIARSLANEAVFSATRGIRGTEKAFQLLGKAEEISKGLNKIHLTALTELANGAVAYFQGQWRQAFDRGSSGEELMRNHFVGSTWEFSSAQSFILGALMYLGELRMIAERLRVLTEEARDRGNLYLEIHLNTRQNLIHLVADNPDHATKIVRESIERWSSRGYHVQHYSSLLALAQIELYRGNADEAWALVASQWGKLHRSLLLRVQVVRIEAAYLRARCAVAAATGTKRNALLLIATHTAKRLRRERAPWASGLAQIIDGCVAVKNGRLAAAVSFMTEAADDFDRANMKLHANAARYALAQFDSGDASRTMRGIADEWMISQNVADPERLSRLIVPI